MRKVLLIIATLFIACGVQAKKIKVQDAELIARQFVAGNSARPLDLAYTFSTGDKPDLYIFNKSSRDGFVVIAADDVADNLVLGYSDRSLFDKDDIPENLRWWLGEYQKQVNHAREKGYKSSSRKSGRKSDNIVVAPLLGNLAWGQGAPYNNLCPMDGKSHSVTGCVATAMAQIMYYNKWPLKGKGNHSYVWKGDTISVDFSKSVYDYSKMKLTYDTYTEEQANAVAVLMRDCGVSINMQYSATSSGAYDVDVPKALTTYFDYSQSVKLLDRSEYKTMDEQWENTIRKELDERRVVYYSGQGDAGGHAFVCDGYKDNGFFHFNFGWSGGSNGYFVTKAITTSSGSFNLNQMIIIGLKSKNKQKVGSLYYSISGESSVAVQSPDTPSEYSGDMIVPASVTIDGKNYQVTELSAYAFNGTDITTLHIPSSVTIIGSGAIAGCKSLRNIVAEWTSPENVNMTNDALGDDIYYSVLLTVPAGCIETYCNTAPWWLFSTIKDTKGESVTFSSWKDFYAGTGTFYYSAALSGQDPGLSIQYRENTADPDQQQIIIANWGGGVNLMIKYDKANDRYVVPRQNSKISSSVGDVYVADMPTAYPDQYTYETCPNTYDAKKGQLWLYLAYTDINKEINFGYGQELFQLDGYPDYSVSVETKTLTEQSDGSAFQLTSFEWGEGITTVKYALVPEHITRYDQLDECIAGMLDGTIETKTVSERMKNRTVITLPHEGKYTIIAIGFDKDGEYTSYDLCTVTFSSAASWVAIGQATYTDDIIGSLFGMDPVTYKVDMEASTVTPGVYRMKYPYGPTYPYNEDGDYAAGKTYDIVINASDPDCVYIEEQKTGCDWGYGNMIIMSMGYYDVAYQGYDWAQVKAEGQGGQLKDNVITFPAYGIVVVLNDGAYYANRNAGFALDLTGTHIPDAIEDNLATRTATAVTYNLQGQQVDGGYKGIVIQNGKKMLKR